VLAPVRDDADDSVGPGTLRATTDAAEKRED